MMRCLSFLTVLMTALLLCHAAGYKVLPAKYDGTMSLYDLFMMSHTPVQPPLRLAGSDSGMSDDDLRRITSDRRLDTLYQYLRDNPFRLAVRKDCPGYFTRINSLVICNKACQAYGNYQLLQNPFKDAVVIHRADTLEERRKNRDRWLYIAANGGVLVSPFISPAEKDVRNVC